MPLSSFKLSPSSSKLVSLCTLPVAYLTAVFISRYKLQSKEKEKSGREERLHRKKEAIVR